MQIIRNFLAKHQITDTKFVIGVSGGADSLALALMFKEEFPDYDLVALTVDHQLRPTSRKEADYVAAIMQQYGIKHHILTWIGDKPETGIEEQAREARYKLMCDWCKENGYSYLTIAHHLYDQAETFLMRLQRGSGLYGLAAMDDVSCKDEIFVLRPLLMTHPDDLKTYLDKRNIQWVEDESNTDRRLLRVKIRCFLPILEQETGISPLRICQAVSDLQNTKAYMEENVNNLIHSYCHNWNDCAYSLDFTVFSGWHKDLQFYFVRKILQKLTCKPYYTEAESIYFFLKQLVQESFRSVTLGNCIVIKDDLRLWFILENRQTTIHYSNSEWEDYAHVHPQVKGIKIPHKLKQILLYKNLL